jgi:hypothetical protein
MASHQAVERVSHESRDDPRHRGETPGTSKVPGHPQSGGRSGEQSVSSAALRWLVPHDRIHLCEFGVSRQNRTAKGAVEGRKLEDTLAIVPEYELHALSTESAGAIVEEDRPR